MALKYLLTLTTVAEPGRAAAAHTTWTLLRTPGDVLVTRGGGPGDPHGDHARVDGRVAAKKDALALGLRITNLDIRVVYAARPAAPVAGPNVPVI